jgi:hypothetical protein
MSKENDWDEHLSMVLALSNTRTDVHTKQVARDIEKIKSLQQDKWRRKLRWKTIR